jgi:hypothetical protein
VVDVVRRLFNLHDKEKAAQPAAKKDEVGTRP